MSPLRASERLTCAREEAPRCAGLVGGGDEGEEVGVHGLATLRLVQAVLHA